MCQPFTWLLLVSAGNPGGQQPSPEEAITVGEPVLVITHLSWLRGFVLAFWKSFQQDSVGSLDIVLEDAGRSGV